MFLMNTVALIFTLYYLFPHNSFYKYVYNRHTLQSADNLSLFLLLEPNSASFSTSSQSTEDVTILLVKPSGGCDVFKLCVNSNSCSEVATTATVQSIPADPGTKTRVQLTCVVRRGNDQQESERYTDYVYTGLRSPTSNQSHAIFIYRLCGVKLMARILIFKSLLRIQIYRNLIFYIPSVVPPPISNIEGISVTTTSLSFEWLSLGDDYTYRVEIQLSSNGETVQSVTYITNNKHTMGGLSPGTQYNIKVYTLYHNTESEPYTSTVTTSEYV